MFPSKSFAGLHQTEGLKISGWKEGWNHTTPEVELLEKYLGQWSYASATHHDYSPIAVCYLYHLIPLIFQNDTFYQRHSLSCKTTEWADGLQTIGAFCLVYSMKNRWKIKVPDSCKRVKLAMMGKGAKSCSKFLNSSIHKTKVKGCKRDTKEGMKYVKITNQLLQKKGGAF